MLLTIAATKAGAAFLITIGALVSWFETSYHEGLLKANISTLTVLLIETLIFSTLVLLWVISSEHRAKRVYNEAVNLSSKEWLLFLLFAGIGILGAYASDAAVLSHGVHSIQLGSIVIGLGLTGGLYMLSVDKQKALKSLPWLLALIISAIGLAKA